MTAIPKDISINPEYEDRKDLPEYLLAYIKSRGEDNPCKCAKPIIEHRTPAGNETIWEGMWISQPTHMEARYQSEGLAAAMLRLGLAPEAWS